MTWWHILVVMAAAMTINVIRRLLRPMRIICRDIDWDRLGRYLDNVRIGGSSGTAFYIIDNETGKFVKFYKTIPETGKPFMTFAFPIAEWSERYMDRVKDYLCEKGLEIKTDPPVKLDTEMGVSGFIGAPCGSGWKLPEKILQDILGLMGYNRENTLACFNYGSMSWPGARGW